MINTQLHNQLIEIEIERKAIEARKKVQEANTHLLKERLRQALYIVGFMFIVLLMVIALLWLLPNRSVNIPSFEVIHHELIKTDNTEKRDSIRKKKHTKKLFSGTEYIKENNYIYKRVYKDGVLIEEEKLAPTIIESIKLKKEDIPQFSTLKMDESTN